MNMSILRPVNSILAAAEHHSYFVEGRVAVLHREPSLQLNGFLLSGKIRGSLGEDNYRAVDMVFRIVCGVTYQVT